MSAGRSGSVGAREVRELVAMVLERPGKLSRALPVVVLVGPRGAGKTALLEDADARYADRVPRVLLDFAAVPVDITPAEAFRRLARGLRRYCPQFGRLPFPLVDICTAVSVAADGTSSPESPPPGQDARVVSELVRPVLDLALGSSQWLSAVDALLKVIDIANRRRVLRRLGTVSRGQGDARDVMVALREAVGDGAVGREVVDRVVARAFRADLRAAFSGWFDRNRRTANCLVLLDNIHLPAGREFLKVLAATADRGPDPMAVVAAGGQWDSAWDVQWQRPGIPATRFADLPLPSGAAGVTQVLERGVPPEPPWFLVRVGELSGRDARGARPEVHQESILAKAPTFVHRLTGGLPWAVHQVVEVARGLPREAPVEMLRTLFTITHGDGDRTTTLVDRGERYLLLDGGISRAEVDDLTVASAARDLGLPVGTPTSGAGPLRSAEALGAKLVNNFLLDRADGEPTRLVLQPWLRHVLLHRLAERPDDHRDSWDKVHSRYRRYHLENQRPVDALYHGLALGDVDAVVRHLDGMLRAPLDRAAAWAWIDDFEAITTAPNRLPKDQEPREQVEGLIADLDVGGVLPRLVVARWLQQDPTGDPAERLRPTIAASVELIAGQARGEGAIVLRDRVEEYAQWR
ncbi:hypothetical protein B0I31_114104 [Saccharothrix carnea]|uniref:Uncharacterized protein n=1 Tax=Saccharothrix carnea TaxID=1280637 RepID=A0A2P8I1D6_SACCR|nr:hypothetical protein [Saccharothrix carnea]PSL52277.1 hypothetical protein B0I31_114104 [Saccharothrix carnea]